LNSRCKDILQELGVVPSIDGGCGFNSLSLVLINITPSQKDLKIYKTPKNLIFILSQTLSIYFEGRVARRLNPWHHVVWQNICVPTTALHCLIALAQHQLPGRIVAFVHAKVNSHP
jgi:hypothetical protein